MLSSGPIFKILSSTESVQSTPHERQYIYIYINIPCYLADYSRKWQTMPALVCGHTEIQDNNLADTHAKLAAVEASFIPQNQALISLSESKAAFKKHTLHMWQRSWFNNNTGHHLNDLQPDVSRRAYKSMYDRKADSKVDRLKMGHSLLKQHLYTIYFLNNSTCNCGTDHETTEHA